MKEANLIDIFGLSGDPASDGQVDALLARLELEGATNLLDANPGEDHSPGIFSSWQSATTQVLNIHRTRWEPETRSCKITKGFMKPEEPDLSLPWNTLL